MRDLRDKTVLDVGCGDGLNSDVLGLLGARVTGIDISSGAIQLAGERCSVNGVTVEFICAPLDRLRIAGRSLMSGWTHTYITCFTICLLH